MSLKSYLLKSMEQCWMILMLITPWQHYKREEMINPFNLWFPSMKPSGGSVLSNDPSFYEHSWNFRTAKSRGQHLLFSHLFMIYWEVYFIIIIKTERPKMFWKNISPSSLFNRFWKTQNEMFSRMFTLLLWKWIVTTGFMMLVIF